MYSWKAIRIACSLLLLLPIVHLTWLMSRDTMETLNTSPDAWAREVASYAAADTRMQLPPSPIVVVGGQRVKLWPNLEDQLAPRPVLMRGLGEAIVEDISFNYSQLIGFYQPDTVVLLPGNANFISATTNLLHSWPPPSANWLNWMPPTALLADFTSSHH